MTLKEFIGKKVKELSSKGKSFPDDFIIPCKMTSLTLPDETLIIGNEFFGSFEILTSKGTTYELTNSMIKAKYIVYAGKHRNETIQIPREENDIEIVVKNYEKYLDGLLKQIESDYQTKFPEGDEIQIASNEIFRKLHLYRL